VARGGFEVGLAWKDGRLERATLVSRLGNVCRVRSAEPLRITSQGKAVAAVKRADGALEFKTTPGETYVLTKEDVTSP
jgi:alpha-L-fucosidase 2